MHILLSWDISAQGTEWNAINASLRECLRGYSWVKPLRTLYIVKLRSIEDRESIRAALVRVCSAKPKLVNLVIGPVLSGGSYSGWLPKSMWPKIHERVDESDDV